MIPDNISDMDSVPDAISLADVSSEDAIRMGKVILLDAYTRYAASVELFGRSCAEAARGLAAFAEQIEIAELEQMNSLDSLLQSTRCAATLSRHEGDARP